MVPVGESLVLIILSVNCTDAVSFVLSLGVPLSVTLKVSTTEPVSFDCGVTVPLQFGQVPDQDTELFATFAVLPDSILK